MRDVRSLRRRPRALSRPRLAGWRAHGLAAVVLAVLGGSAVAAEADEEPDSLCAAARTAVANGQVEQTRMLGFSIVTTAFHEVPPEGAVLVGFDLGLGRYRHDLEAVYAVRPIYLTAQGDKVSPGGKTSTG
jgi:hypothetical protein